MDKDIEQRALEAFISHSSNEEAEDEDPHHLWLAAVEWAWTEATEKALHEAEMEAIADGAHGIAERIRALNTKPETRG